MGRVNISTYRIFPSYLKVSFVLSLTIGFRVMERMEMTIMTYLRKSILQYVFSKSWIPSISNNNTNAYIPVNLL